GQGWNEDHAGLCGKAATRSRETIARPCWWVPVAPVPAGPCSARLLCALFHAAPPLHVSLPAQSHSAIGWARRRSGEQFGPGRVIGRFALFSLLGWGIRCGVRCERRCFYLSLLHSRQDAPN